jgi:hypothetical protein
MSRQHSTIDWMRKHQTMSSSSIPSARLFRIPNAGIGCTLHTREDVAELYRQVSESIVYQGGQDLSIRQLFPQFEIPSLSVRHPDFESMLARCRLIDSPSVEAYDRIPTPTTRAYECNLVVFFRYHGSLIDGDDSSSHQHRVRSDVERAQRLMIQYGAPRSAITALVCRTFDPSKQCSVAVVYFPYSRYLVEHAHWLRMLILWDRLEYRSTDFQSTFEHVDSMRLSELDESIVTLTTLTCIGLPWCVGCTNHAKSSTVDCEAKHKRHKSSTSSSGLSASGTTSAAASASSSSASSSSGSSNSGSMDDDDSTSVHCGCRNQFIEQPDCRLEPMGVVDSKHQWSSSIWSSIVPHPNVSLVTDSKSASSSSSSTSAERRTDTTWSPGIVFRRLDHGRSLEDQMNDPAQRQRLSWMRKAAFFLLALTDVRDYCGTRVVARTPFRPQSSTPRPLLITHPKRGSFAHHTIHESFMWPPNWVEMIIQVQAMAAQVGWVDRPLASIEIDQALQSASKSLIRSDDWSHSYSCPTMWNVQQLSGKRRSVRWKSQELGTPFKLPLLTISNHVRCDQICLMYTILSKFSQRTLPESMRMYVDHCEWTPMPAWSTLRLDPMIWHSATHISSCFLAIGGQGAHICQTKYRLDRMAAATTATATASSSTPTTSLSASTTKRSPGYHPESIYFRLYAPNPGKQPILVLTQHCWDPVCIQARKGLHHPEVRGWILEDSLINVCFEPVLFASVVPSKQQVIQSDVDIVYRRTWNDVSASPLMTHVRNTFKPRTPRVQPSSSSASSSRSGHSSGSKRKSHPISNSDSIDSC